MHRKRSALLALACALAAAPLAAKERPADLFLQNGRIYTVNPRQPLAEAVAVRDGRVLEVGSTADLKHWVGKDTTVLELHGHPVYPGFKDSHAHVLSLGLSRLMLDLTGAGDFEEVVARVQKAAQGQPPGAWIVGSGWHEGKWSKAPADAVRGFPVHRSLSATTPNNPAMLERADGHAVLANAKAMELMHVTAATQAPSGGEIIHDAQGAPTGVFVDAAMDLIKPPPPSAQTKRRAWQIAFEECLRSGITAADEAGLDAEDIALLKQLGQEGRIPIRMYAMLSGWPTLQQFPQPQIGLANGFLTIRSVKLFADGALGSRGAAMLEPYEDDPGNSGLIVTPVEELRKAIGYALDHGFQVNTHAIGDRGNRLMLDLYEQALSRDLSGADHRWRIEHAQVLDGKDIPRLAKLGVIASMQTIHATSDRPWAADRIGIDRVKEGAYAWRKLLASGARIANGTDAPVESIDPIRNFYAAVTRMDDKGQPPGGFDPEERMTREEALRSYTLDGAYATFTEKQAGSIEAGKNADFVVLSRDIMQVPEAAILGARVEITVVAGRVLFMKRT
jgi:predicted amidohydrolase YtcJ